MAESCVAGGRYRVGHRWRVLVCEAHVTPLSDALTAAQRSALQALEKAYVAGQIEEAEFTSDLSDCGISDPVDVAFLLAALDVLKDWGVSAPTMTEKVAEAKVEPLSNKQLGFIFKLAAEKHVPPPDPTETLTKEQASEVIGELQAGTYDPEKWRVPF